MIPGDRQRVHRDDQGQLARLGHHGPGAPLAGPERRPCRVPDDSSAPDRGPRATGSSRSSSASSRTGSSDAWQGANGDRLAAPGSAARRSRPTAGVGHEWIRPRLSAADPRRRADRASRRPREVLRLQPRAARRGPGGSAARGGDDHRPLRLRQDDAPALHQLPRGADRRIGRRSTAFASRPIRSSPGAESTRSRSVRFGCAPACCSRSSTCSRI